MKPKHVYHIVRSFRQSNITVHCESPLCHQSELFMAPRLASPRHATPLHP
eukprot:SAG11_NODE_20910_length_436_cov_0.602374_1_plen_49_part_10